MTSALQSAIAGIGLGILVTLFIAWMALDILTLGDDRFTEPGTKYRGHH